MSLAKRISGRGTPPNTDKPSSSGPAFDNDADFISFDNDETMPGLNKPEPSKGFNIKGRAARSHRNEDEEDMQIDDMSSSDDALPKGITVIRSGQNGVTQNAQGAAISATHVLPPKPPTGPTYTGGYDSPLPRTSSPIHIKGAGQPSTLPPPPPQKYLSHNLNTNEASSSSSASRKEKLKGKKGKKRKADVLSDEEDPRLSATKSGEYMPWVNDVEWFNEDTGGPANIFKLFNQETRAAARWLAPTKAEHDARSMLVTAIVNAIQREFRNDAPGLEIEAFGSHVNELYLPGGDIDIVIVRDSFPGRIAGGPRAIKIIFNRILAALRYARICPGGNWNDAGIQMILGAKCPIVKLKTIQGNISVDISLYDDGGIRASRIVTGYLMQHPAARDLVLLVKAYMRKYKVNEVFMGGLGSYATFCLVVSFLQRHPSVNSGAIDPRRNLGVLFQEFFDEYARFEWETYGISLRDGGKRFRKIQRSWVYGHQDIRSIAIEDPQDPSNNISKGSTAINQIFACWTKAGDILDHNLSVQEKKWEQYKHEDRPRLWLDSRGEWDPTKMSLLKDVVGFSAEILDHRRALDDLYWSGELQHMVGKPPPSRSKGSSSHSRFDDNDEPRKHDRTQARASGSHAGRSTREEDKYAAIHMNDDPRSQQISDNSDDEVQHLDRLARKGKERSEKKEKKKKLGREQRLALREEERRNASAGPAPGSKEAEMGLDSDEDGAKHRPIEVDDESDGDVIEIVDNSGGKDGAETVRYQDTLPSDRNSRGAKRSRQADERDDHRIDRQRDNGEGSSRRMDADERRKYWADKGPREAISPPPRQPPKGPKKSRKGDHQHDRGPQGARQVDKEEDFSNLTASAGDAIDNGADFVSIF